jgi:hypothetical protein
MLSVLRSCARRSAQRGTFEQWSKVKKSASQPPTTRRDSAGIVFAIALLNASTTCAAVRPSTSAQSASAHSTVAALLFGATTSRSFSCATTLIALGALVPLHGEPERGQERERGRRRVVRVDGDAVRRRARLHPARGLGRG